MSKRRSRSRSVRGRPNYLWIATAGSLAQINGSSAYDHLLIPGDWSGTVTEQGCTLLRMTVCLYTQTAGDAGAPHSENFAIALGSASEAPAGGIEVLDCSNINDWPDFCITHDRILHTGRVEWDGNLYPNWLPVQFSQLPEPVMNLKRPRRLTGEDSVRLYIGGRYTYTSDSPLVIWFCRFLVRVGLK